MDIVSFASSFALVGLAELGDKTQLAAVTLSARRSPISVLLGAILAFALVDGLSALLGGALAALLSTFWVSFGSGLVFVGFGNHTLMSVREEDVEVEDRGLPLATSFSLVALMELGDKNPIRGCSLSVTI